MLNNSNQRKSREYPINIPNLSQVKERRQKIAEQKQSCEHVFGITRTAARFKHENDKQPVLLEKDGWTLRYFNIRSEDTSDYVLYRNKDVDEAKGWGSIPVIEFNCDNHTLKFNKFGYSTILENIPPIVYEMIDEFTKSNNQTTNTKPVPVKYLKLYVAVLDEVPDFMVPTLVAHSMLGAHLMFESTSSYLVTGGLTKVIDLTYKKWLTESFRKCVIRVNRKEFEKIKQLDKVYLGHENTTLDGEKSCAIPYPVWSDEVPNVLKFSKLWKPSTPKSIVYFDMDGVLADFEDKYNSIMSKLVPIEQFSKLPKEEKDKIKEELFTYDFFRNMKPIQKGLDLLKYYQSKYEKVVILSATGDTSNSAEIEQAKRDWLQEHVGDIEAHFSDKAENKVKTTFLYPEYQTHILIDDRNKAIDPWIANGGVGVLYV